MNITIKDYKDLAEHLCIWPVSSKDGVATTHRDLPFEQWESRCSNRVYKNTSCGAWLRFIDGGIEVGSIVEGVDQGAEPITLQFSFTTDEFYTALQDIEDQCQEIWDETHGCSQCEFDGFENPETGYIMINPECPNCKGLGIVI